MKSSYDRQEIIDAIAEIAYVCTHEQSKFVDTFRVSDIGNTDIVKERYASTASAIDKTMEGLEALLELLQPRVEELQGFFVDDCWCGNHIFNKYI